MVRRFGAMHVLAGLLTLVEPAVTDNDAMDSSTPNRGCSSTSSQSTGDTRYCTWCSASSVWEPAGTQNWLAGVSGRTRSSPGVRRRRLARFGSERGVHLIAGIAVDGWGNLGHTLLAAFSLVTLARTGSQSSGSRS